MEIRLGRLGGDIDDGHWANTRLFACLWVDREWEMVSRLNISQQVSVATELNRASQSVLPTFGVVRDSDLSRSMTMLGERFIELGRLCYCINRLTMY